MHQNIWHIRIQLPRRLFTLIKPRTIEFCKEVIGRKLDIAFHIQTRVDALNEEVLEWLRKAGCKKISFGFESGSEQILKNVKKRANLDQARKAVEMVNKAGIHASGSFIIGNVGDTEETIKETIAFAKTLKLDTVAFQVSTPFPGTELYAVAKQNGWIRSNAGFAEFATISKKLPVLNLPTVPAEDLFKWSRKAYRSFYMRPSYLWYKFSKIRSTEDVKNLYEGLKLLFRVSH